jgi:hypothetical protein
MRAYFARARVGRGDGAVAPVAAQGANPAAPRPLRGMNRMTLLLLCAGVAVVAGGLGLGLGGARRAPGTPAPARFASHRPADRPAVAPVPAGRPIATVAGSEPHTHLTLLALRRTARRWSPRRCG